MQCFSIVQNSFLSQGALAGRVTQKCPQSDLASQTQAHFFLSLALLFMIVQYAKCLII